MRRIALLSLLALAAAACAPNPALDVEQTPRSRYTGNVGESPVGVIPEGSLRDAARNRDVQIAVDYPTRPGPHPLILFSHAFGGSQREYVGLSSFWASQGYVVVRPAHADSGRAASGSAASLQQAWTSQGAAEWRARVQDIVLVLDQLDQLEQRYPELQGKIDRTKIGVGGHSYGAFTAMLAGGARTFPGGTTYGDPRIKAVLAMAPPGPGETRGLTTESWRELRVPTLFMTGTRETGATETETAEWRREPFNLAAAGDKWLIVLEGGDHSAYTGRMAPPPVDNVTTDDPIMSSGRNPVNQAPRTNQQRREPRESMAGLRVRGAFNNVKALSLAFWDAYLRADAEGRQALEAAASRGGITLERR